MIEFCPKPPYTWPRRVVFLVTGFYGAYLLDLPLLLLSAKRKHSYLYIVYKVHRFMHNVVSCQLPPMPKGPVSPKHGRVRVEQVWIYVYTVYKGKLSFLFFYPVEKSIGLS